MRNVVASTLLLIAACASTSSDRPANIPQPQIRVGQAGPVFLSQGPTPITIDVEVTNRASVPLVIREVEISSSDSGQQYGVAPARRLVNETIPPGETRKVSVTSSAVAQNSGRVGGSVQIRASVRFEAEGKSFRELVLTELAPLS
jgi:hypothetical protein